eukprot:scpid108416/ scgid33816/ 
MHQIESAGFFVFYGIFQYFYASMCASDSTTVDLNPFEYSCREEVQKLPRNEQRRIVHSYMHDYRSQCVQNIQFIQFRMHAIYVQDGHAETTSKQLPSQAWCFAKH